MSNPSSAVETETDLRTWYDVVLGVAFPNVSVTIRVSAQQVSLSWENGPTRRRMQRVLEQAGTPYDSALDGRRIRLSRTYSGLFYQRVEREVLHALDWSARRYLTMQDKRGLSRTVAAALEDRTVIARLAQV